MKSIRLAILGGCLLLIPAYGFTNGYKDCNHESLKRHKKLLVACESTVAAENYILAAKETLSGSFTLQEHCDVAIEKLRDTRFAIHQAALDAD